MIADYLILWNLLMRLLLLCSKVGDHIECFSFLSLVNHTTSYDIPIITLSSFGGISTFKTINQHVLRSLWGGRLGSSFSDVNSAFGSINSITWWILLRGSVWFTLGPVRVSVGKLIVLSLRGDLKLITSSGFLSLLLIVFWI